jgi:hypothetical protein
MAGMIFGIVLVLTMFGGVVWYKKGMPLPKFPSRNENTSIVPDVGVQNYYAESYDVRSEIPNRVSIDSNESRTSDTARITGG